MDTHEHTLLEQNLYNNLAQALVWLENIATQIGDEALVDACPNYWGGRADIRSALVQAESEHPELAEFPAGTYITDGTIRGHVLERGMMLWSHARCIPAYRVDTGGGHVARIPANQARRA